MIPILFGYAELFGETLAPFEIYQDDDGWYMYWDDELADDCKSIDDIEYNFGLYYYESKEAYRRDGYTTMVWDK
jgi:hypothetical protein